jgi:SAM-dependent methyltransferase
MTEGDGVVSHLATPDKARRSGSFGAVASHYDHYRPGPPQAAVDWLLPSPVGRVVDLGAGTGALTRLLSARADEVVAVEPDERMRSVLIEEVPGVRALAGRGESIPLPDGWADAVTASSSWHWMDLVPTLAEVGRVLVAGGVLGVVSSGPDPEGSFMVEARALLAGNPLGGADAVTGEGGDPETGELAGLILGDGSRPESTLEIPPGVPFTQPDHRMFRWDVALNADELIGLLGTFSWVIMMPEDSRERVTTMARRLLRDLLGVEGDVAVDVTFRCDVWRARRRERD